MGLRLLGLHRSRSFSASVVLLQHRHELKGLALDDTHGAADSHIRVGAFQFAQLESLTPSALWCK
jgi:hypothetical protein